MVFAIHLLLKRGGDEIYCECQIIMEKRCSTIFPNIIYRVINNIHISCILMNIEPNFCFLNFYAFLDYFFSVFQSIAFSCQIKYFTVMHNPV